MHGTTMFASTPWHEPVVLPGNSVQSNRLQPQVKGNSGPGARGSAHTPVCPIHGLWYRRLTGLEERVGFTTIQAKQPTTHTRLPAGTALPSHRYWTRAVCDG